MSDPTAIFPQLAAIERQFEPGTKLTLVARHPREPYGGVIYSADNLHEVAVFLQCQANVRLGAEKPQPEAGAGGGGVGVIDIMRGKKKP